MELNEKEMELIFAQSRQTIQEISGWKMFIFLPQSITWRLIMIVTVSVKLIYNFTRTFYMKSPFLFTFIDTVCDVIYCFDAVLSTLHFSLKHTRKLRHGKKRNAIFLVIDYISLIPLETIYMNTVYNEYKKDKRIAYAMNLVGVLRIYHVPKNFSYIKESTYKLKFYMLVTLFQVVSYTALICHFLSCFLYLYFDDKQKKHCLDNFFYCVTQNIMVTFYLLSQDYESPFTNYPLEDYSLLLIVDYLVGYFYFYGYVIPLFLFVSIKALSKYFEYSKQLRHLTVMTENSIENKKLRKKVLDYFREMWAFGRTDKQPELLDVFPLGLKKNIFCDMHWEAMKHSYLLQDVSFGCKRSLALCMRTEFLTPNALLFQKNEHSSSFLYIESGRLQVMAEENSRTPVLNLSEGTVLGEMSFFLHTKSLATVRAENFSVIHTLPIRDFFQVLVDYPKDKKKILRKVKARLKFAKSMNEIKINVFSYFMPDTDSSRNSEAKRGNIKWIKSQYRAICDLKNAEELLLSREYTSDDYERQIVKLDTQVKHTSVNLPYICFKEGKIKQKGAVCLRKFPWLMDPHCQFVSIWRLIIYVAIMITLVLYPAIISFCPYIPQWFFNVSCVVSLIYILDIFLTFTTAVENRNVVVEKYSFVFVYRITSICSLIDFLAALPLQLLVYHDSTRYGSNLYFLNALLKLYVLVPVIYKLNYSPRPLVFVRTASKYALITIILIYFTACVFYLTGVECIFYFCGDKDWYAILLKEFNMNFTIGIDVSFLRAVYLVHEIPEEFPQTDIIQSYVIYFVFFVFCHCFYFVLDGECTAAYVLEMTYYVEYSRRVNLIYNFMVTHKMSSPLRRRVMSTMEVQYIYDKKNYITEKEHLWDALPPNLKTNMYRSCTLPLLSKSKLFELEDEEFLLPLCRKFKHLVLPANSLLLTLGIQTTRLYIVQKGFVQINSFIAGDLHLNNSRPISAKVGDFFPVIDVFSQSPSSVTAVTVTECELLVIELEDVLSEMIIHGIFKDLVEAIKETDLSLLKTAKLGVSQYKDEFCKRGASFEDNFKRLKGLGTLLKCVLKKRAINSQSTFYIYWELSRVVFILFYCIGWPIAIGCCYKTRVQQFLFKLFSFSELMSVIDFYIRLHVAYYNKKGLHVSHTLYTAAHYLTTAFMADFIAFSPNFHVWLNMVYGVYYLSWPALIIHMTMRSFSLYRLVGYLSHLEDYEMCNNSIRVVAVLFFLFLLIHYYVCFLTYLYILGIMKPKFALTSIEEKKTYGAFDFYLKELSLVYTLCLKGMRFLKAFDIYTILCTFLTATLGLIGHIWLYAHLTLVSTTSDKNSTDYQYYMQSFVNYLLRQRADEKIIGQAVGHFEYEWQQTKGEDLGKIFRSLPQCLNEDITNSLYRSTLGGISSLSGADECFYRTISRQVQEIYFDKGSVIIYQKQVQANIFIVHSGVCSVENSSRILFKGAMIGDIKLNGIMTNTITSLTPVKLLKIPSVNFFKTLDNFYTTKLAYQADVAQADDFLISVFVEQLDEFPVFILQQNEVECEFVPFERDQQEKKETLKNRKSCSMKYDSKVAASFRFIFFLTAYATILIIPLFVSIKLFSPVFLSVIYILDLIWVVKLIMFPRMISSEDKPSRISKKLAHLGCFLRILFHISTVFPLELIPFLHYGLVLSEKSCFIISLCYMNRILRVFFIFKYFKKHFKKKGRTLLMDFFANLLGVLMLKISFLNSCFVFYVFLNTKGVFEHDKCYRSLTDAQKEELVMSCLCVISDFIDAGMDKCQSRNVAEVVFYMFQELFALLLKAYFINQMLMIVYVTYHNKSNQMIQLEQLDNYLSARDVSPVLREGAQKYFCNLLNSFYEGADTSFLSSAPPPLRTAIMEDIYMPCLKKCYLFQDLDEMFLKQLTARLYLNIFFPGDYIAEKGDVDHNIYFIQSGEVYCIQADTYFEALERATDLYTVGTSFGIQQGILSACSHTQTYRAKTLCNILVLNYYRWEDLRVAFPDIFQSIYKLCQLNTN